MDTIKRHFVKVWCLTYICLFYVSWSKGCPKGIPPLVNFEARPQRQTTVGSNITLYCTSSRIGEQFETVLRFPLSIDIYKRREKLISCTTDKKTLDCAWRIDNVNHSDADIYFCVSNIEGGASGCMLRNLTLDVKDCTNNKSNQLSIQAAVTKNNTIIITWNYAIESCDKSFIIYWSKNRPVTRNSVSHNLSNLSSTSYEIEGLGTTIGPTSAPQEEDNGTTDGPSSAPQEGDNSSATTIIIVIFVVVFVCLLVAVGIIWRVILKRKRPSNDSISPVRMQTNAAAQNLGILFPETEERMPSNSSPSQQKVKLDDVMEDDEIPEYLTVINSEYLAVIDEWEVPRDRLIITNKKLGVGQFGVVKKGIYRTMREGGECDQAVAVKELKENASEIDRSDLLTELRILKFVNSRPHPNILKLIGACTSEPPVLVITEYCSKGNLRDLLKSCHSILTGEISTETEYKLDHHQLLKIAVDVASGMEHLASMKFVHRDLAARNILIGEGWVAKIADFGLARETATGGEYIKTRRNLLPVKWTAIEALVEGKFSTASDVWSYGVLLWEISNIGGEPYKGISPYDIMSHVGSGGRLGKPERCSPYLYEIMKECWETLPEKRPSFKDIHEKLAAMLDQTENLYINVEFMDEAGKSNGNYERYTSA